MKSYEVSVTFCMTMRVINRQLTHIFKVACIDLHFHRLDIRQYVETKQHVLTQITCCKLGEGRYSVEMGGEVRRRLVTRSSIIRFLSLTFSVTLCPGLQHLSIWHSFPHFDSGFKVWKSYWEKRGPVCQIGSNTVFFTTNDQTFFLTYFHMPCTCDSECLPVL